MTGYTLNQAVAWLRDNYPVIASNLTPDILRDEPEQLAVAQQVLDFATLRLESDGTTIDEALDSFAELSFDFLRLQATFLKTGRYARESAVGLSDALYNDADQMRGRYLSGLLLSYALWPNHTRMLQFFDEQVIRHLAPSNSIIEVGVGHGLMASRALMTPGVQYTGVDISPHSIQYCKESLEALRIDPDRYSLETRDATIDTEEQYRRDWLICCEVLEHVDDPLSMLRGLKPLLKKDGRAFVSTVANLEAEDHVYLFNDVAEIETMIADAGFAVENHLAMTLPGSEGVDPLPVNYAATLRLPE